MKLIGMAWRNLLRQKRRTLVTLSALIVGVCGVVVFQGYIVSLMTAFRDSTIRAGIGHLQIAQDPRYFEDGEFNPYAYIGAGGDTLVASLSREKGVTAAFPSTGFTAIAGKGDKSVTLLVKGYPPQRMFFSPAGGRGDAPTDRFALGTLVSGSPLEPGQKNGIVLGETAARILDARPGSVITLMAVLPNGGLGGRDFTVAGVYRSPGQDKIFSFTDYDTAADFTGIHGAPVVHVIADSVADADAIAARLPAGRTVRTWHDLATFYVQANTMFNGFLTVIRAIILLVTLFIMANTMNKVVLERMKEWGTLRAIGMKKARIVLLVVLEGCLQGVVGAAIGSALGFGVAALLNLHGGLPYLRDQSVVIVRLAPTLSSVWRNLVPAALFAGIASFLPGLRAVRLTPSECLRQI